MNCPDRNLLDFYFWNQVKTRVYTNRLNKPFREEKEECEVSVVYVFYFTLTRGESSVLIKTICNL